MLLVARSMRVLAARGASVALLEASGARGFAAKTKKKEKKSKGKKGGEDANFEQMLRAIKGQYPEAYVCTWWESCSGGDGADGVELTWQ
jgi:hypothetical protein